MARLIRLVLALRYGRHARVPDRLAEFAVTAVVATLCWRANVAVIDVVMSVLLSAVTLGVLGRPGVRRLVDPPVALPGRRVVPAVAVATALSPAALVPVVAHTVHGRSSAGVLTWAVVALLGTGLAVSRGRAERCPRTAPAPAPASRPAGGVRGRLTADLARRRTTPLRRLADPFVGLPLFFSVLAVGLTAVVGETTAPTWALAAAGAAAGLGQALVCGDGDDRPGSRVGLALRHGFLPPVPVVAAVVAVVAALLAVSGHPMLALVPLVSTAYAVVIGRVVYIEPTVGGAPRSRHRVAPPPTPGTEIGVRLAGVLMVVAGVVAFG